MKNILYDNFLKVVLKVPIVEKCDLIKKSDKEIVVEIGLQDGYSYITTIHLLKNGYPKQIQDLSSQLTNKGYNIVAAPFISDAAGKVCEGLNIGYIDAVGNCLFQYHLLYINISGNKNKDVPKRALKSIFEGTSVVSSKILREMFQDVNRVWRFSELARQCDCSIGQGRRNGGCYLGKGDLQMIQDEDLTN